MGFAFDLRDTSLTSPGNVPGTVPYLSPEQMDLVRKRQMDFRSDLFQLGIVMYVAATGQHPFAQSAISDMETLGRILTATPVKPSLHREMPSQLEEIILRLLAKKPHLRFKSCHHLIAALDDIDTDLLELA